MKAIERSYIYQAEPTIGQNTLIDLLWLAQLGKIDLAWSPSTTSPISCGIHFSRWMASLRHYQKKTTERSTRCLKWHWEEKKDSIISLYSPPIIFNVKYLVARISVVIKMFRIYFRFVPWSERTAIRHYMINLTRKHGKRVVGQNSIFKRIDDQHKWKFKM